MYDLPELREATDAWWQGLRKHLKKAGMRYLPQYLERPKALDTHWLDATLIFSQTCGYPLTHALAGRLQVIGTPCYDAPGCNGPRYTSFVMVSATASINQLPINQLEQLRGARCVVNARDSQSGYSALRALIARHAQNGRFFSSVDISGGHRESLQMVSRGEAEVCAIDCVTHALLKRYAPQELEGLRVLTQTGSAPALPYVTASVLTLKEMHTGILAAFADPELAETRAALLLKGMEVLPEDAYQEILNMETVAFNYGFPQLK